MHSDLLARSRDARDRIVAPPFPLGAIRAAVTRPVERPSRRRTILAVVLAGVSVAAIAAADEVTHQAHLSFVPSGGMVISPGGTKNSSRDIRTDADIREAAKQLDFQAVLPAGLPDTAVPMKADVGPSMLVITYALPASGGRAHKLWVFLVNPAVISGTPAVHHVSRRGNRMEQWRAGAEQVIVVSDGLTTPQFAAIKNAMEKSAPAR